jgi:hypothetical protein
VHSATRPENSSPTFGAPGRGLGFRFLLVFLLDIMVHIVEHQDFMPEDFMLGEEAASSTPQSPTTRLLVQQLLLCTLRGSTLSRRRPGRLGLRLGHCPRPENCCATLLAPRPRRGP